MLTEQVVLARIRSIREQKGYTQYYMAYCLHISQNAFSKIELGNVKLTVERMFEIATVLGVYPAELLDTENTVLR